MSVWQCIDRAPSSAGRRLIHDCVDAHQLTFSPPFFETFYNIQPRDYSKNSHKGFGFVEFDDADDAAEALDNMDGAELMGRTLNVSLAQANGSMPAHNKAVWSTDEWFQQQAAGAESEADQEKRRKEQTDQVQLKEQVAMP
jgi:RNA recognition motif-containing protein